MLLAVPVVPAKDKTAVAHNDSEWLRFIPGPDLVLLTQWHHRGVL